MKNAFQWKNKLGKGSGKMGKGIIKLPGGKSCKTQKTLKRQERHSQTKKSKNKKAQQKIRNLENLENILKNSGSELGDSAG